MRNASCHIEHLRQNSSRTRYRFPPSYRFPKSLTWRIDGQPDNSRHHTTSQIARKPIGFECWTLDVQCARIGGTFSSTYV